MWPFCKKVVDCDVKPNIEDVEMKLYEFQLTYMDNLTTTIVANEFNWNEHDVVFRKDGLGIFWVRANFVKHIRNCNEFPLQDTIAQIGPVL